WNLRLPVLFTTWPKAVLPVPLIFTFGVAGKGRFITLNASMRSCTIFDSVTWNDLLRFPSIRGRIGPRITQRISGSKGVVQYIAGRYCHVNAAYVNLGGLRRAREGFKATLRRSRAKPP